MAKQMPRSTKALLGKTIPNVALRDHNGNAVRLIDFRGRKVILFFYVRDDTPGCTREACGFRDKLTILDSRNATVLGISPDNADSHKKFAEKYGLRFPLLVDQNARLAKRLGVWGKKNMYGRTFYGIIRSTFIINEQGRIMKEYRHVKVDGHIKRLLDDLKPS